MSLRSHDNLPGALHGVIICDPEGRPGGGYVVGARARRPTSRQRWSNIMSTLNPQSTHATSVYDVRGMPTFVKSDIICRVICEEFALDRAELVSDRQTRQIARARAAYYIVGRDALGLTSTQVGKKMNVDHSTVLTQARKYRDQPAFMEIVTRIRSRVIMGERAAS